MARDIREIVTCDPCDQDGYPNVMAVTSHIVSIDGKEPRAIDVCVRDELLFQQLAHLYEQAGRPVRSPEKSPPHKKPKAVKATTKGKELEAAPARQVGQGYAVTQAAQQLICPLDHPSQKDGGPRPISYKDRSSHADQCHVGMKVWDIHWGDPHKILTAFCTHHEACKESRYGFTTERGVAHHLNAMRKQKNSPSAQEQEGAPQKSDDPAP